MAEKGIVVRTVIAAFAVAASLAACGGGSTAGPTSTPTVGVPTEAPDTPDTTAAATDGACSTAGVRIVFADQRGLPDAVAEMRERVFGAAVACDYGALSELAGPTFTFTFGGGGDPVAVWRAAEEAGAQPAPLLTLATLLNLPSTTVPVQGGAAIHVWPSAFGEDATDEDWAAFEAAFGAEQAASWRSPDGHYLGFRVGIDETGDWLFFVAAD